MMTQSERGLFRGTPRPDQLPGAFMQLFNSGSFDRLDRLFDPLAVRVMSDGSVLTGPGRGEPTRALRATGARLQLTPSGCFSADGIALLLTDCIISDSQAGSHRATAIDVARRDPRTGWWTYLIDNPAGVGFLGA